MKPIRAGVNSIRRIWQLRGLSMCIERPQRNFLVCHPGSLRSRVPRLLDFRLPTNISFKMRFVVWVAFLNND